ncbi:MAG: DNA polymerase III subunit beta [candidate division WS1 bacterium]|nr:DNA polymerase III subunit beta [candidate division WS1 bacterium]
MLNLSCQQEELHASVQTVSHGVSGRSTQPVQNNIYLESTSDGLRLMATDLEFISIGAEIGGSTSEQGAVTVPARLLTEVIGSLSGEQIHLEADENNVLSVTGGRSSFRIRGMSAADFEMLPEMMDPVDLELSQRDLHSILSQTVFATSRDETRPILTGALFNIQPGGIEVVATDTYRLALRKMIAEIAIAEPRTAIISRTALDEVLRVLDADSDDTVRMALSDTQVAFTLGNVTVGSRLIEGQFPNYEKVLPDSTDRTVKVSNADLTNTLRRMLIVAREDANRVVLRGSDGMLTITADSQDVGHAEEQIPAQMTGEEPEIAFNARYLLDALQSISREEVVLELSQPLSPGTLKPADSDEYLYVIMPMQIM